MVLVRTKSDKIYGGYTHYPWRSAQIAEKVSESDCRAFIFSVDMKQKFMPHKKGFNLITWDVNYGPYFGEDIILGTFQRENFPNVYKYGGSKDFNDNHYNRILFAGKEPDVVEYEVFALRYK